MIRASGAAAMETDRKGHTAWLETVMQGARDMIRTKRIAKLLPGNGPLQMTIIKMLVNKFARPGGGSALQSKVDEQAVRFGAQTTTGFDFSRKLGQLIR